MMKSLKVFIVLGVYRSNHFVYSHVSCMQVSRSGL